MKLGSLTKLKDMHKEREGNVLFWYNTKIIPEAFENLRKRVDINIRSSTFPKAGKQMHWYLKFSELRKTLELGKVSVYALTSLLLLRTRILFAVHLLGELSLPWTREQHGPALYSSLRTFLAFCYPADGGAPTVQEASKTGCCWSYPFWERAADAVASPLAHAHRGCTAAALQCPAGSTSSSRAQRNSPSSF